jgi:hypothetical protein
VLQNPLSLSVKLGNELQASDIPLLASPQGGVAASSRKFREATEADAAVVFLFVLNRKTTPSALPVDASHYFLSRAATLLAVMQGGEYRSPETHSHLYKSPFSQRFPVLQHPLR